MTSVSAVGVIAGRGAAVATEEDAEAAARALQVTVRPTFRDLRMRYLPRRWLEIIAVRP